ncbi:hypothetical protein [Amphritea japonica]|uniref:Uncharacterized protein n=1 Tax=Amphritea japonica ATCC BAA-1530 TaxID=1278309 RepID=A0A7R6PEH0_9GAMM|nr:hypothetical protein [Amphritea japonica]BBB26696.1 conserved hypothetical protein [Amphritea japonica ATCC BAA-1530]
MNRVESLSQIINFGEHREQAYSCLVRASHESVNEQVGVTKQQLLAVLNRYIVGDICTDDLEEWAMFVECRDDINHSAIEDYIYALSNPMLMGEIDKDKIVQMAQLLTDI